MSNLYDIEWFLEQRRREIDDQLSRDSLLRQLPGDAAPSRRLAETALRVRVGLMLIRLGSRLAV